MDDCSRSSTFEFGQGRDITLWIKTWALDPADSQTITVIAKVSDTIGNVKAKIQDIDLRGQCLSIQKFPPPYMQLEDSRTLLDYNIQNESTLHLDLLR